MTEFRKGDKVRIVDGVVDDGPDAFGYVVVLHDDQGRQVDRCYPSSMLTLVERPYVPQVGDIVEYGGGLRIVHSVVEAERRAFVSRFVNTGWEAAAFFEELTLVGRTIEGRQPDA